MILALLLLAGGAVVNVAVAWGFAACFDRFEFADHGLTYVSWSFYAPDETTPHTTIEWRAGYPLSALRGEWSKSLVAEQREGFLVIRHPMFNWSKSDEAWLPYHAIWPGFIINTLFYALLLWLLFFAPFAARRMLRRRRGLCEQCAYPIGVSPVCTECGAAVSRRVEA